MRWQTLFRDLELELEALYRQQAVQETREQIRTQLAEISLQDRLRGNIGNQLRFTLAGGHAVQGVLDNCYAQWLLLTSPEGEALIPARAIAAVEGLQPAAGPPPGPTANRLTLGHALRALARDRSSVAVHTTGEHFFGMFGQIGSDWAQLRTHLPGQPRTSHAEVTLAHEALCVVLNKN
ncbi:MAG TPA: hypothetical protein VK030_05895 [Actinomycetales bacterium]|nr:hypothetical protein [Actinomycetales bacterium]